MKWKIKRHNLAKGRLKNKKISCKASFRFYSFCARRFAILVCYFSLLFGISFISLVILTKSIFNLKISMKLTTIRNFLALATVATFVTLGAANAQNIAVVDLETVLKSSKAMKDAQNKISKKQTNFQKEIDKKQKELEKENKKIESKKSTLSDQAFEKEQKKFSQKVDELKELVTKRQDELKKSSLDAISKINDKVKDSVEEIRKEKNLDIIISAESAVFYKDDLDISEDVTKLLNKKISTISIK
jgi:outer membrane protein